MQKKKLYLLTGFLGAGKTTTLKEILNNLSEDKSAVIMNEFGRVGIDGKLLEDFDIELSEINRGSIFCSCLQVNFVTELARMAETDVDRVFVEGSGLADPSNIGEILEALRIYMKAEEVPYIYGGAICVVDARTFEGEVGKIEAVVNQVEQAQMVVVNKVDLVEDTSAVIEKIRRINSEAEIAKTEYGRIEMSFFHKQDNYLGRISGKKSSNTAATKPKTFTLNISDEIAEAELTNFLYEIAPFVYRVKGFSNVEGDTTKVDMVGSRIDMEGSQQKAEDSSLVLLTKKVEDMTVPQILKNIVEAWDKSTTVKMKIKNG